VGETPAELSVDIVVVRNGKQKTIPITIGALNEPHLADSPGSAPGPVAFGLRAKNIGPDLAAQMGLEDEVGVVITEVQPGSPADEAGLEPGDIIVEVDRKEIADVRELNERLGTSKGSVLVLVRRGDNTLYIPMKSSP
jgi:serine protease Do